MKLGLIYPYNSDGDPPIGLASMATYLKEYMNFSNTRIIDVNFEEPLDVVKSWKPDVVGISAMTGSYGESIGIARKIRQEFDIPVLIGGVHISTLPSSLHEVFDIGAVGEGEQTMLELMQLYEREGAFPREKLKDIPGLVYRDNGRLVFTKRRELIKDLDKIPIPDRTFMNENYHKKQMVFWYKESYGSKDFVMTSRGCPYKCAFCSTSKFWKEFRLHSPEYVAGEIKMLVEEYKADHIGVWDDLFTYNKKRIMRIKELLEEEGVLDSIKTINCTARVNMIDDELCRTLKGIKVNSLNFGFECGSNRVLKILKKQGVTVEKIRNAVRTCIKNNIDVSGSFILGSPGETLEDMEETVELLKWMSKEGVDRVWTFVMTPYPATEVWDIAKERGKVSDGMNWEKVGNHLYDVDNPLLLDESISKEEFKKMWAKANAYVEKMKNPRRRIPRLLTRLRYEPAKTLKYAIYNPEIAINFTKKIIYRIRNWDSK